jgi:hypothetical protein
MPDFDGGFKIAARTSGEGLCRLAKVRVDALEPIGDTVQTTERLADRAFRARAGNEHFIVYFEAYKRWTEDAPWSVLAKSGLLSQRERLTTRTVIFVLRPERYREQDGLFNLHLAEEVQQFVRFKAVCLWREKPEDWWQNEPGLMALYPLSDHGQRPEVAIRYAAQAIKSRVKNTVVRADLLTTLGIFGRLIYQEGEAMDLIGREFMRESGFFDEIMKEGRIEERQASILQALGLRFGEDAVAEFTQAINAIRDLDRLSELLRLAIKSRGIKPFRRALTSTTPAT